MRVLILSASAGDGHLSAARALEGAFLDRGADVRVVDALDCAPRLFRLWFCGGYEGLVRHWKDLWGLLYRWSDRPSLPYAVQTFMDDVFLARLDGLAAAERPDWIICTQALPLPRLARLAKTGRSPAIAVVITDTHPHRVWLRGNADRYFVPADCTRAAMEARRPGIGRRTEVTGIPIHRAFAPTSRRVPPAPLPNAHSILLAAGGIGAGPMAEALRSLMSVRARANVTVICGRNVHAHRACRRMAEALPTHEKSRLLVLGYVDQEVFAAHLAGADLLVGKPGGLTMAECLAVGTPMVVYAPLLIPGQEEGNARFVREAKCGVVAADPEALRRKVEEILASPDELTRMRNAAQALGRPYAAQTIADRVLGFGAPAT